MLGTRSNHSKRNSNSGLIRLQKETMKCFSRTHHIMEADDFCSQNSVSDIIAAHMKMLSSFEKYFPEHEDPQRQNMWIMNTFVEHKETVSSHDETLQLIE